MKDYPQRKLDCNNNELELFTRTTFARAKVFSSKEMVQEFISYQIGLYALTNQHISTII